MQCSLNNMQRLHIFMCGMGPRPRGNVGIWNLKQLDIIIIIFLVNHLFIDIANFIS